MTDDTGRTCVFCERREKMHHEHLISDWIGELLPDLGKGTHKRIGPLGKSLGSWHDQAFKRKVGCVCRECNNHWMNDLENAVKPWLTPPLLGRGRTFYETGQSALATWAFKTALMFGCQIKNHPVPRRPYEYLYEHRSPPPEARIWIGAYNDAESTYHAHVPLAFGEEARDAQCAEGFLSTFAFGWVAFHVFLGQVGEPSPHAFKGKLSRSFGAIWPVQDAVTWPPDLLLGEADLDMIANAYGRVL